MPFAHRSPRPTAHHAPARRPAALRLLAAGILSAAAVTPACLTAQDIDTRLFAGSAVGAPMYAQSFTVGTPSRLTSFALFVEPYALQDYAYVGRLYAWDGTATVGAALYTSEVRQTAGWGNLATPSVFTPATPLTLTTGAQYLAVVQRVTDGGMHLGWVVGPNGTLAGDVYAGGVGYIGYNGPTAPPGGAPDADHARWFPFMSAGEDLMFTAQFAPTTVPEPGTWALLGTGLLAVGGVAARGRRRRQATR